MAEITVVAFVADKEQTATKGKLETDNLETNRNENRANETIGTGKISVVRSARLQA